MAQRASNSGGYYCESNSSCSDEEQLDDPRMTNLDPLRVGLSEIRRPNSYPSTSSVQNSETPLLDLTKNSIVRIRFLSEKGKIEEAEFKWNLGAVGPEQKRSIVFVSTEKQGWTPPPQTFIPQTVPRPVFQPLPPYPMYAQQHIIAEARSGHEFVSMQNPAPQSPPTFSTVPLHNNPVSLPVPLPKSSSSIPRTEIQPVAQPTLSPSPEMTSENARVHSEQNASEKEMTILIGNEGWRITMRQYQLDLYRAARIRNVIAYLDTGSGKTFISVLLIRDVASMHSRERNHVLKKTIFFLVPKKVLVHQQAHVLRQYTDLAVSEHSGDRNNEDIWDVATWRSCIDHAEVLVMTPQILLNMLRQQAITMSHISLIVFDECHHTRKNNPYNCIMQVRRSVSFCKAGLPKQEFYHPTKQKRLPVPKIFGMTASLVTRKRSFEEVCNSFLELENNLDSLIMTARRENVSPHATSATEIEVKYSLDTTERQFPLTFSLIERSSVRLTIANKLGSQRRRDSQKRDWQVEAKKQKGPLEQHIRQIGNIQHVIYVMGLLAGSFALTEIADSWMERETKKFGATSLSASTSPDQDWVFIDERIKRFEELRNESISTLSEALYYSLMDIAVGIVAGLFQIREDVARHRLKCAIPNKTMTLRHIQLAVRQIRSKLDLNPIEKLVLDPVPNPDKLLLPSDASCSVLISHRMQHLFRVLTMVKQSLSPEERSEWRGMIFVQQTLMAIVLEHVISLCPYLSFFKCQSLTGHNGAVLSASMEDHHQRKIVNMFRKGQVNLLICTSVAEEGLDITQCAMVIRFDLPVTEASYIQSRGRARKPGSLYTMFINQEDPSEMMRLGNLRFAEQCMKEFATYRQEQVGRDLDEDIISGTHDADLEISKMENQAVMHRPPTENAFSSNIAVEMIYKYVQQLPQDEYCQLMPHLIFRSREKEGRLEFQYQLTLPINAAITKPILGEWQSSKQKAKKSACYAACVELRNLGELNEMFYPVSHNTLSEFKKRTQKLQSAPVSIQLTIDPQILNPNQKTFSSESECSNSHPMASVLRKFFIYLNAVTVSPMADSIESFGILTLKPLDCDIRFPLFVETGEVWVDFRKSIEFKVSSEELLKMKKYHMALTESLYFKTKFFSMVCRKKRTDFESLIDGEIEFLPRELQSVAQQIPYAHQSWYLLCPIQRSTVDSPLSLNREMEKAPTEDFEIDWKAIDRVTERVDRLTRPGIRKINGGYGHLRYGEVFISPYNNAAYKLVGIRTDLNLNSAFPSRPKSEFYDPSVTKEYKGSFIPNRSGQSFSSFLDYYTRHWKFENLDENQPLLECVGFKHLPILKRAKNLLNPFWYQANDAETVEEHLDDWNVAVHLIPQLVVLYPLDYGFWKSLSLMVAVCWRMESTLKVKELGRELFPPDPILPDIGPPDVALLYESVTSKSCHEHYTYERLEFMGDAVLKYISSLYCFFKYPLGHEGILTTHRIRIISNRQLARVALSLRLEHYIRSVQLGDHPWRPAGCQLLDAYWLKSGNALEDGHSWFGGRNQKVSQQNQFHQSSTAVMATKQVADVVEALIGACYVHGDLPCVCALLNRLGVLDETANFLLATQKGSKFGPWLEGIENLMVYDLEGLENFDKYRKRQFEHGRDIDVLETTLGYRFTFPALALEAVTHCSWPHPDPPCYQRLEYLGDAVLDFMVSSHYYKTYSNLDPGQLTLLRAATVNNDRLAITAMKSELYKHILHFSSYMQSHITEFIATYNEEEGENPAPKVLGDIVESLIGAVYLDLNGDISRTWEIWSRLLEPMFTPETVPIHPVVSLANYCNFHGLQLQFQSVHESKSANDAMELEEGSEEETSDLEEEFAMDRLCGKSGLLQIEEGTSLGKKMVQVIVNGKVVGEGEGAVSKAAKRIAAANAMKNLPWDLN